MKKLWMLTTIVLAALFIAGLAACGGGDDDDGADEPTATVETTDEAEETDEPEDTPQATEDEETPEPAADADLEGYFADLEAIIVDRDEERQAAVDEHNAQDYFGEPEFEYEQVLVLLTRSGAAWELFTLSAAELEPPSDIQAEHDALVEASADYTAILSRHLEGVQDTGEMSAAQEFIENNPEIDPGQEVYAEACSPLQDIADDAGIVVDLACEI